jgi:hypothetical protein
VTHGSLMRDIPRLEPDDEFVDQLAQLAAASKPTRGGVVVPVAFRGSAARSIAAAAAVAAIAGGATVAAAHLGQPHDSSPVPPANSVGTSGADDDHSPGQTRTAQGADPSETGAEDHGSPAPDSSPSTNQAVVPTTPDDHGSPGSDDSPGDHHGPAQPNDDPSGHDAGDDNGGGGPGGPGSDTGSGGHQGGNSGNDGGSDGGNGSGKDSGKDTVNDSGKDSASDLDGSGD